MRFPKAQFQALARNKGGAIVEPGDGELVVPALIQPELELHAPFSVLAIPPAATTVMESSFHTFRSVSQVGVAIAQQYLLNGFFSPGIWRITATWRAALNTGTAQYGNYIEARLYDGGAATFFRMFARQVDQDTGSPGQSLTFLVHIGEAGWHFEIAVPATILGDNITAILNCLCARIL